MKTTDLIPTLTAALLLAAALSPAHAASLINDGDFDSLPVGMAPDYGKPAGPWYLNPEGHPESVRSQVAISPSPAGGTGHALTFSLGDNENPGLGVEVINNLTKPVTAASGQILNVSFDIYVKPGVAGPSLYLSNAANDNRAAQLLWLGGGLQATTAADGSGPMLVPSYPRGVWQTVRLEMEPARRRYNFYWSEKGQPVSVTRTNLHFHSASPVAEISKLCVLRFYEHPAAVRASVDNFRVTTDPAIAPVTADLAAGGTTTLQVVNLPAGDATFQWWRNGQAIVGATAATLELGNVTADQAGNYTVVVTRAGQSVTTEASTIRVFNQLTITTPPEKIEAVSGKTTGFSVAAVGPLPMTYQWRFNGADLPDKTNRFLTFPAKRDAAGDYSVVISDANGSVVSEPAKLSVLVTPTFVQAPLAMKVVAGSSVTFSAAVAGTGPFTYQWRKGSAFDGSTVRSAVKSAETNAFFTVSNVQASHGGTYRLYLGNPAVPDISSTSPSRSFTLTVLPDTDSDGLPDEWETAHGFNPADASDAAQDQDGDGTSNLAEYQSGTHPADRDSMLKVQTLTQADGQVVVSFPAAANQTYTVEASNGLGVSSWEKVTDVVAMPADRTATVTDPRGGEAARFYRVVTPRRP